MTGTASRARSAFTHLLIILIAFVNLAPLLIVVSSSLRSPSNMTNPLNWFNEFTFESFRSAFNRMHFPTALLNSVILTGVSVIFVVLLAAMAAYPMARIRSKTSKFLYLFFLSGLVVPGQMVLIPIIQMIKDLGIPMNQYTPILMFITCSLPFSTFLYTGFIRSSVPEEMEEAAHLDGAGLFRRFWIIVFPLILPVTVSVVITQGVWIWNDYFFNMVFITKALESPIPVAMLGFLGDQQNPAQWNVLFAACILCVLPLLFAFLFLQKYFIGGLTVGSVKG
ncbi:carbohydrate ABC transporter permease [Cohnella thailandensis]|jgi:ABC-type sugar transport system, permease component|uniref:Carbohydrate ABC transporter permease n=1 Tax=Cohnella thailandensis TaxID=557557 RepID=A0A841SYM5_9BACL|nr:carbohydrate ABC transporter permease [Cohnella thailandensis]MBB6634707.1 carbohydrate ABC transporter permease [Cohnella thailandensis]MBP1972737.1 raffinose/stachyose/melibiose transport system permease protein [Cohnella thailandensis]